MFLHVSVSHSVHKGGGVSIPACIAGFCPQGGVVSPHALQVSRSTSRGRVEGSGLGEGSPGSHPGGKLRGLAWEEVVSRPTPGGSPDPHLGDSPGPHPGGSSGPHPGGGGSGYPSMH